jgi:ribosomal protein S24E
MKQTQEITQVLHGRTRYVYEHDVQATTPARAELQQTIAKLRKADPSLVTINNITSVYGTGKVIITADVYTSKNDYKKSVPAYLSKKSVVKEAPKEEQK